MMGVMEEDCEDLPVWVGGTQRWVTGLTRRTTADDVIYALLYNDGLQETESTEDYAIFERWRQVERPLQARTKILKIWRAWGEEQPNVQLSMRRLDDYFLPGDHPRSRRRRRSRQGRHSRQCRHSPGGGRGGDPGKPRSVESLVRLVVSQERQIQELMGRLRATDHLIESYETRLHQQRSRQEGRDYVQNAYLDSLSSEEDSLDEFLAHVDRERLDQYLHFCDKVVAMETQIQEKQAVIQDLSAQIDQSCLESPSLGPGCGGGDAQDETLLSGDPETMEAELEQTLVQIHRLANANMVQRYEEMQVAGELQQVERLYSEKQKVLEALERELSELDKAEEEEAVVAAAAASEARSSQHRMLQHHQQQQQQSLQQQQLQSQSQPSHVVEHPPQYQQSHLEHPQYPHSQQWQHPQHHHQHPQQTLQQQQQYPPDPRQRHHWEAVPQTSNEHQQQQWGSQYPSQYHYSLSVQHPLHVQGHTDSAAYPHHREAAWGGAGGARGAEDFGDYTFLAEEASSPDSGVGVDGAGPRDPRDPTRDPRDEEDEEDAVGHIHVLDKPPCPPSPSSSSPSTPSSPPRPSRPRITRKTHRARSRSRSQNREEEPWWKSSPGSVNCDAPEGAYHVPSASVRDTSLSRDEERALPGSSRAREDMDADSSRQRRRDGSEDRGARGVGESGEKGHGGVKNGLKFHRGWDSHYHPNRSHVSQVHNAPADQLQNGGIDENKLREITNVAGKPSQSESSSQAKTVLKKNGISESILKDAYHHQHQNGMYSDKFYSSSGFKQNGLCVPQPRERPSCEKSGNLVTPRNDGSHRGSGAKSVHFLFDEVETGNDDDNGSAERRRAGEQQQCVVQTSDGRGLPPPYSWHGGRTPHGSLAPGDPLAKASKDDSDSNSDTGLSSMHSDEAPYLETLV